MNIVLYSGGTNKENKKLDLELLKSTQKEQPKITYVPFTYYEHPRYFEQFKKYWRNYGVEDFVSYAPNRAHSLEKTRQAFSTDIIFLSSGNTFSFIKHLRDYGLIPSLNRFLKRGGILAGASAGAIVMTPNIMTAVVPFADSDPNHVGVRSMKGMNLVGFEFSPHFDEDHSEELRSYSRFTDNPVLACEDGSGLVVRNGKIKIIGSVYRFKNGRRTELNSKQLSLENL